MGDDARAPVDEPPDAVGPTDHDHAWRRVSAKTEYSASFEYQCDICAVTWSM